MFLFFFSSRRRHTRCSRDWSSDVCSSDLIGGAVLQQRRRLAGDGSVVATIVVDRRGWLAAPPQVSLIGLAEANAEPARTLCDALADAMEGLPAPQRHDDAAVRDIARRVLRRGLNERFGKRPLIEIQLV